MSDKERQDDTCPVCQNHMRILDRVLQIAPNIFVCVPCGWWLQKLTRLNPLQPPDNLL